MATIQERIDAITVNVNNFKSDLRTEINDSSVVIPSNPTFAQLLTGVQTGKAIIRSSIIDDNVLVPNTPSVTWSGLVSGISTGKGLIRTQIIDTVITIPSIPTFTELANGVLTGRNNIAAVVRDTTNNLVTNPTFQQIVEGILAGKNAIRNAVTDGSSIPVNPTFQQIIDGIDSGKELVRLQIVDSVINIPQTPAPTFQVLANGILKGRNNIAAVVRDTYNNLATNPTFQQIVLAIGISKVWIKERIQDTVITLPIAPTFLELATGITTGKNNIAVVVRDQTNNLASGERTFQEIVTAILTSKNALRAEIGTDLVTIVANPTFQQLLVGISGTKTALRTAILTVDPSIPTSVLPSSPTFLQIRDAILQIKTGVSKYTLTVWTPSPNRYPQESLQIAGVDRTVSSGDPGIASFDVFATQQIGIRYSASGIGDYISQNYIMPSNNTTLDLRNLVTYLTWGYTFYVTPTNATLSVYNNTDNAQLGITYAGVSVGRMIIMVSNVRYNSNCTWTLSATNYVTQTGSYTVKGLQNQTVNLVPAFFRLEVEFDREPPTTGNSMLYFGRTFSSTVAGYSYSQNVSGTQYYSTNLDTNYWNNGDTFYWAYQSSRAGAALLSGNVPLNNAGSQTTSFLIHNTAD